MNDAHSSAIARRGRAALRSRRENTTSTIVESARNNDAAGVFAFHASDAGRAIDSIAGHQHRLKARCADSES
jgi:hypothetical protein